MIKLENIFYINLERRLDRRAQIEKELSKMGLIGIRFPGVIYEPTQPDRFNNLNIYSPVSIGCQIAHLELLKMAKDKNFDNVIIFEDDFEFIVDKTCFYEQINNFNNLNIDFDVLFLSYNVIESEPLNDLISYGRSVQTASGYIVNSKFYNKLISNLVEGLDLHIETQLTWKYCNDQYWKSLQKTNQWFYFNKKIGQQRGSYSDILGTYLNYGV
jgi:GR25 family glycosyltransferase involved in LPS biosynthesis